MTRACNALTLEEEKHVLLAKAHLALAAKCRLNSVEETRRPIQEAYHHLWATKQELLVTLRSASAEVRADRATMLVVLSADGWALRQCSDGLRNDPEMILEACRENGYTFELASCPLRDNRDFVAQAVRLNGDALAFASPDLQADREIVWAALQSEPDALTDASGDLKQDRDLVLEALRLQTRRNVLFRDHNVLSGLFDEGASDKELVLEGTRVDGSALAAASSDLRKDKDFVLEVMRRAPWEDQRLCYNEVHESVRATTPFEDFQGACASVLAHAGEEAPVLTVTMPPNTSPTADGVQEDRHDPQLVTCEVCLLSGCSFTCNLSDAPRQFASGSETRPAAPLTVGRLAELVKMELLAHIQVAQPPERISIVLTTKNAEGEVVSVPVTPWDWDRPVAGFS